MSPGPAGEPGPLVARDWITDPIVIQADGARFTISSARADKPRALGDWQPIEVVAVFDGEEDALSAGLRVMPLVDWLLDYLGFAVGRRLARHQANVAEDAGGGSSLMLLAVGLDLASREQDQVDYPAWNGGSGRSSRLLRRAVRFFLAGLEVPPGEEAFIQYWTALEHLFTDEGTPVREPLKIHDGCVIDVCPVCGRSTVEERHGLSMRQYLVGLGIPAKNARDLYQTRQVVHGRDTDSRLMAQTEQLRALVGGRLAERLGFAGQTAIESVFGNRV